MSESADNRSYLLIMLPEGEKRIELDSNNSLTIGRREDNIICLNSDRVSRYHCVIQGQEGDFQIIDRGSHNGTGLNGHYIEKSAKLKSGDLLSIGGVKIRFIDPKQSVLKKKPGGRLKRSEALGGEGGGASGKKRSSVSMADRITDAKSHRPSGSGLVAPADLVVDQENKEVTLDAAQYYQQAVNQIQGVMDRLVPPFTLEQINLIDCVGQEISAESENTELSGRTLVRLLLLASIPTRSTDIHIEPRPGNFGIRYRIDGVMVDLASIHQTIAMRVTSAVKVLSHIDIAQKQIVQEGHFSLRTPNRKIDYRVSFTPTIHGQKLVLRIHDIANCPRSVKQLKLANWVNENIQNSVKQDSGMLMVCGPTGSGKTTTLYAIIRDLDVQQRNVVTIEDPIEYQLPGITQMPVNEQQGNTFSNLLRSVLRQDPDIILLGEVRDAETAKIAMQAAVTGHQVLSTVHARDVISSVFRLIDLGVEPYLVASALDLVLAQRLVRQLCPECRVGEAPTDAELERLGPLGKDTAEIFKPRGCPDCLNTGFMGRRAMFEMLNVNEEIRDLILSKPSIQELRKAINETGFTTLRDFGCSLVAKGVTSLDEVDRVAGL